MQKVSGDTIERKHFQDLNTSVYLAIKLAKSVVFNVRKTEDSSYGIWANQFIQLLEANLDIFVINPQLNIYSSSQAVGMSGTADPDATFATTADPEARGVYPDLAVVVPRPLPENELPNSRSPSDLPKEEVLRNFFTSFSDTEFHAWSPEEAKIFIWACTVPLIAEIKPPPSRHPADLEEFVFNRDSLMIAATDQAMSQALCLFATPRFCMQDRVLIIAACGDIYAFTILNRHQAGQELLHHAVGNDGRFDYDAYQGELLTKWMACIPDDADSDEPMALTPEEARKRGEEMIAAAHKEGKKLIAAALAEAKSTRRQNEERDKRAERRHMKGLNPQQEERLHQLGGKIRPFSDKDIEEYEDLMTISRKEKPAVKYPELDQFKPSLDKNDKDLKEYKWSRFTRLGSERSVRYMNFISQYLHDVAEGERKWRGM
jgi:hypothetical protein